MGKTGKEVGGKEKEKKILQRSVYGVLLFKVEML